MKKFFRFLVPFLLVLAILGSTAWYLLVYDPDFTRDMLLTQARNSERTGYHKLAAWFYDLAYTQSSQDEDVAIELAQQYKNAGNYIKAEATLSKAIADGGTAKLYTELCKTYVEQDKLLDAVNMLDTIPDPAIKAELDALRPAVPTADPAPDFYNQYISVSLAGTSGTLYATSNGEYPSLENEPYQTPFTLEGGETTIYALCVGDNGLVSPLSILGYTVGGVIEQVTFEDKAFESAIRDLLGVDANDIIFSDSLWTITEFTMPTDATVYSDLRWLPYLKSLTIVNGVSSELYRLAVLQQLEELRLYDCRPTESDMSTIASLPLLSRLTMDSCGLSSISDLTAAQNLTYLNLSNNTIRNINPLAGLSLLEELYMPHNALTDLAALSNLSVLRRLDVSFNALSVIDPVCSLENLAYLNVCDNMIVSLGNMDALKNLTYFNAENNALNDVSALAGCTLLQELDISSNQIADLQSLSGLSALIYLDFSYNTVAELPYFSADCPLVTIDGSYNLLNKLDALAGLQQLNNVLMDYNEEIESVEPLYDCPRLIQVNVYGTKVTDVSYLTDQSVIVNFNPTLEE